VIIKGTVHSGCGESSDWMKIYVPWLVPGTLNVRLHEKRPIITYLSLIDTHYGSPCKLAKCKINNVDAFIILAPLGKEHKGKVEIGAKFNIREKFNLNNGNEVEITFL
jgi:CTP-dependent riboflavin kinase